MAGRVQGKLQGAPKSPNCVTSMAPPSDAGHHTPAWSFDGDVQAAKARLEAIVLALPRTALVEEDGSYLHFTFTTRLFRWVDDVEFLLDAQTGRIDVRSASRTGWSDMGVNRKRVDALRAAFEG